MLLMIGGTRRLQLTAPRTTRIGCDRQPIGRGKAGKQQSAQGVGRVTIKTKEQYEGYLQRLQSLMRDDFRSLSPEEDLEFEELVRLISLYELETLGEEE